MMLHASRAAIPPAVEQKAATAGADEEELFDEQLREFGHWSGAALGRGAAIEIEKERCPGFLREFEESTLLRGQSRPGQ